ncbi:protrudin isoform X2 [Brienomyrus brachyistius]|uniref:protrudin isoform X2 n=1 Tax=Brienomyrus brachyistius TaxID=42636 RepID=UPI0020B311C1|nr:protrudin isoform X2 [Brienomyrus brachyistius]
MQAGITASPEGLANGGDRGGDRSLDPSQLSPRDAGTIEVSDLSSPKPLTFDLLNMVVSFKRMVIFLEPVNDVMELVKFLLGWRMPLCSLFCCVVLNVLFLTLSEVAWFSLCLLGISTPAALGYFQECRRGSASEAALRRKQHHAVQRRDLQTVRLNRQEALLEVKGLLKQLDDILTQTCLSAESVYKVLYWESHIASSMFYGSLLVLLFLLYTAPTGWTLVVVNSALFLWNRDFRRVILEKRDLLQRGCLKPADEAESPELEQLGLGDHTPTPNSMEDFSPGSVEEAEEAEPDDDFKDAIEEDDDVPAGAPEYDSTSDNGLLSRNEPIRSKVSKLTERLRKLNSGANNAGNCSSCNAVFSVLKKRRNCSSCGNSFCSRCCSFKVLKSTMGATAPEALKESVFVCGTCNTILTKD